MSANALGPRQSSQAASTQASIRPEDLKGPGASDTGAGFTALDLGDAVRLSLMLAPRNRGSFAEQLCDVLAAMQELLSRQAHAMTVTSQTIFLGNAADQAQCELILRSQYGEALPVTNFVFQPPCCGAAVALEAWAVGGRSVGVERFGSHTLAVHYDGIRWVYCGGVTPTEAAGSVYAQTTAALEKVGGLLKAAGSSLEHVVRTWFYLGGITEREGPTERYKELNRARTDCYQGIRFHSGLATHGRVAGLYPASTGIGMSGNGLVIGCSAMQTRRKDAVLLPLENPQQTPAYAYHPKYSPQSPKFSRGMALVLGKRLTVWVSGTASIVDSESRHPGDIAGQTEQTIDNIERLIGPENFAFHGLQGAGARLQDLAKVRVYVKRASDFPKCREVCQRRFGPVPTIYAIADICRPELLVEIEGIAFSGYCCGKTR